MKKRITAIILLSALLLTSCSNNDVSLPTTDSSVVESVTSSDNSSEAETTTSEPISETTTKAPETTTTKAPETTTKAPETTTTTTSAPVTEAPTPEGEGIITFSKESGIYGSAFELSISADASGQIYYTLDGSDPTISDTAVLYNGAINITDRKNDKNVVSAVDPVLFAGSYNKVNSKRNGFTCEIKAPSDKDVDKCTVVRAAVKKADGTFGTDSAATYFIGT
ncbi:MAG: chitobiase/beta-hexosaminidase C-terminal domain-containing protein, partial [Ruminiclostridium sp.]|nr:chitobiase/beta-hexosaminidase C-terminal domain-containing protein [Ruminiclostridium sp.]